MYKYFCPFVYISTVESGINIPGTFINFDDFSHQYTLISAGTFINLVRKFQNFFMTPIDSTHQDEPKCTLERVVWPIRTGRNLPLKLQGMSVYWPKIQYALITSMIFLGKSVNTVLAERTKPNVFHITMRNSLLSDPST